MSEHRADIIIKFIPHKDHRYETVGDWWFDEDGTLHIRVSQMSDHRYEQLVAIHELHEAILCKQHGVTAKMVDDFDMAYAGDGEPGDAPNCPYRSEHTAASALEYMASVDMDVDWDKYDAEVESL